MCSWPSRNDEDRIVRMSVLLLAALSVAITQARLLTNVHMYPLFATHSKGDLLLLGNLVLVLLRTSYAFFVLFDLCPCLLSSCMVFSFGSLHLWDGNSLLCCLEMRSDGSGSDAVGCHKWSDMVFAYRHGGHPTTYRHCAIIGLIGLLRSIRCV